MKMEILCIPVGMLQANCYLVWDADKNAVAIDPGASFDKIKSKIDALSLNVQKIIFTHGHFDHIGAAKELANYTGASIFAYKDEKTVIESDILGVKLGDQRPTVAAYIDETEEITVGNLKFQVLHTPGHTAGGICLYIDYCLFSGDTIFKRYIGRCDLPTGDIRQMTDSIINKIFTLPDDTVIYPGHDAPTTVGEEKRHNEVYRWL